MCENRFCVVNKAQSSDIELKVNQKKSDKVSLLSFVGFYDCNKTQRCYKPLIAKHRKTIDWLKKMAPRS